MYATFDHTQFRLGHDLLLNGPNGFIQFELWNQSGGSKGSQCISSSQPTRIGKGEQMRSLSVAAVSGWIDKDGIQHDPIASLVILASPSEVLARQVIDPEKYKNTYKRFGMNPLLAKEINMQRISSSSAGKSKGRGGADARTDDKSFEALDDHGRIQIVSCTNSMVLSRAEQFVQLCRKRKEETGLPVLVWFDEAHRLGQDTKAHIQAELLMAEAEALAITMTASPARQDGTKILGFSDLAKEVKVRQVEQVVGTREDDPNLVDVDVNQHTITSFFQVSNVSVPWDYAWNKNCLCKVNIGEVKVKIAVTEDGEVSSGEGAPLHVRVGEDGQERKIEYLHELLNEETMTLINESTIRKAIGMAVRDPRVIRETLQMAVARLRDRRAIAPAARMVVFGGNDRPDGSDNEHLMQIKRILQSVWRTYFPGTEARVMVCTMKDEGTQAASSVLDRLKEFEHGPFDVILLKQMASEGWDTQTTKVGVNLSPIRSYPFVIQTTMRVGTPWEFKPGHTMLTADWITLADPYWRIFSAWLHDNQGGPVTKKTEVVKVDELVRAKHEQTEGPGHSVEVTGAETGGTSFMGHAGTRLDVDPARIVASIRRQFPELQVSLTDQQLWEMYLRGAFPNCDPSNPKAEEEVDESMFEDVAEACRAKVSEVQRLLKAYVNDAVRRVKRGSLLGKQYGEAVSQLASRVVDEHNRKHPSDQVPSKFSGITNAEVAKRFLSTASSSAWDAVAERIIRQLHDRNTPVGVPF